MPICSSSHLLFCLLDVIFSTAHKSKGMEFDTVALLDDFEPKLVPSKGLSEDDAAEQNLLYVAVTRAK